jgi:F-type H+-transporting ATPase subunit b
MMSALRTAALAAAIALAPLVVSATALAEEPSHGAPAEAHGEASGAHGAAADAHGEAPGHGDAHGSGHHAAAPDWTSLGFHAINLAILVGVLVFALRRPLADALGNRAHEIRKEITDAARARDEAQKRYDELLARLSAFEAEVTGMKAQAQAEAAAEEQKLVARAHDEAARLGQIAERNIREELVRSQLALRKEAVDLAVQLAEETLRARVQSADQARLARQFLDSLTNDPGAGRHG